MKMLLSILVTIAATSSFAAGKCESKIADLALAKINKTRGFNGDSKETRSIVGVKALHTGGALENYVVLASDEVEPSEWLMVVDSTTCKIKFMDITNDGSVSELWD